MVVSAPPRYDGIVRTPHGSAVTKEDDAMMAPLQFWTQFWGAWLPKASGPATPRAMSDFAKAAEAWRLPAWPGANPWQLWSDYWIDACQRTVLFWDVMRRRGNTFLEHEEQGKPPVLTFKTQMVLDGRTLPKPVNYFLMRVLPPAETSIDRTKRPFVVVDPRAGHGPGIGGSKLDSELGVAMKAGHPCYFVGFHAEPEPGQTLEDVARAEARFVEKVAELHPEADGRPTVIGNCQAGWAVMMLSAAAPELMGPIILVGAPLSYWSGTGTQNPMRYAGGFLGGSWLASLASDLGNGRFDGVHLVANFESLNPANTLWSKPYNLYAKIDTEAERYLDFEKWWGGFFLLNEDEMRFIVNNLFVGNRLAGGEVVSSTGRRIDLRNIKSPIVVFASWGDNITPPQQALNWILDCYTSEREILAREQTIVYLLHHDIGHLGIFVSGRVAQREHAEIVQGLDLIETLPPGLWEMLIEDKHPDAPGAALIPGRYLVRFESRRLDDIRGLEDTREDERAFAAVARMSEVNEALYRTFISPWVKPFVTETTADMLRRLHPNRMQYYLWSDRNPWMKPVAQLAAQVREHRRPVAADNPFVEGERRMAAVIEGALNGYRDARDKMFEVGFSAIYGSPWVRAMLGLQADAAPAAPDEVYEALIRQKVAALRSRVAEGGLREAAVRMLLWAGADAGVVDSRGFHMMQRVREEYEHYFGGEGLNAAVRRQLFRDQYFMLLVDEERALAALPKLVPQTAEREAALEMVRRVLTAKGELAPARKQRLARLEALLMNGAGASPSGRTA
jgi:pimeloyl-ACP methyl ester carboxylesterase